MIRSKYTLPLLLAALLWQPLHAFAAGSGSAAYFIPEVRIDVTDTESLRKGASTFFTNCVTCHSIKFMRYQRIADDLGYDKDQMSAANLLPKGKKMTDYVLTNLGAEGALAAYGIVPPDLSLKTREKGTAWMHAFLTSYYEDKNSKTGFNNAIFAGTAMPNLLLGDQGILEPVYQVNAKGEQQLAGLKQKSPGSLSEKEFYNKMRDLVAFLDYVSEPSQLDRASIAPWVFLFLFGLLILCYLFKREVWKDVH